MFIVLILKKEVIEKLRMLNFLEKEVDEYKVFSMYKKLNYLLFYIFCIFKKIKYRSDMERKGVLLYVIYSKSLNIFCLKMKDGIVMM